MSEIDLVKRLLFLVSLHEPKNGGPYARHAAEECMRAMRNAADEIERLTRDCEGWERVCDSYAAENQRLWDRAEAAEARVAELEEALRGVIAVADRKTDEFDRARAALSQGDR